MAKRITAEERESGPVKGILTRVNQRGWKDLKMLALEKETTMNALAVEAFNDILRKYGRRASVENPLLD